MLPRMEVNVFPRSAVSGCLALIGVGCRMEKVGKMVKASRVSDERYGWSSTAMDFREDVESASRFLQFHHPPLFLRLTL